MTDDQKDLIESARQSISAAEVLLASGFPGYAASRVYYAMFYLAESLLEGEGLSFSKHSAVIAAFGKHFANTGKVPVEFHRYLLEAYELRHKGDYGEPGSVSADQARDQISRAEKMLEPIERLCSSGDRPQGTSSR